MRLALSTLLALCLLLSGCPGWGVKPSWLSAPVSYDDIGGIDSSDFDGPLGGHFGDDGEWIPDDPNIARTYAIPDLGMGSIYDARTNEVSPSLQIEIVEFTLPWDIYFSTYKVDLGVAHNRVYGYFGVLLTSIYEISVGGLAGWNFDQGDYFYGVGFTLIKF